MKMILITPIYFINILEFLPQDDKLRFFDDLPLDLPSASSSVGSNIFILNTIHPFRARASSWLRRYFKVKSFSHHAVSFPTLDVPPLSSRFWLRDFRLCILFPIIYSINYSDWLNKINLDTALLVTICSE